MRLLLLVGIGGFFGSTGRYLIGQIMLKLMPSMPLFGTLIVNILGSFILGILVHASIKLDKGMFLLLTTGFCGGFTTFSTFSIENIRYLTEGRYAESLIYIVLSLILGLGAALFGWFIGKNVFVI